MATLNGTDGDDVLTGTESADTIDGRGGSDTINGLGGNDTLRGGPGADTFVFRAAGGNGSDTLPDFDPVYDTLRIESDDPNLGPYYHADLVAPGNGDLRVVMDTNGNGQTDDGDEYFTVRAVLPVVPSLELAAYLTVEVNSSISIEYVLADFTYELYDRGLITEDDILVPFSGDDLVFGTPGNDRLDGGPGNDYLIGEGGDDTLDGGPGDDWLHGGHGHDVLDGGAGRDTVSYVDDFRDPGVTIDLSGPTDDDGYIIGSGGSAEGDRFRDIENIEGTGHADTLTGDNQDNTLSGFGGNDTLAGGGGNDTLVGGFGDDTLFGGGGNDIFVFESGDGADAIEDFDPAADRIDLQSFDLSGIGDSGLTITTGSADTQITVGDVSITLAGVTGDLVADDFIF